MRKWLCAGAALLAALSMSGCPEAPREIGECGAWCDAAADADSDDTDARGDDAPPPDVRPTTGS